LGRVILFFLVFLCFSQKLSAYNLVLQGVHIVGRGNSALYDIYIQDGKIIQIQPHHGQVSLESTSVLDFHQKWVLPGLIDLHCSLFSSPGGGFSGEEYSLAQIERNQKALLKSGITSIRILECPPSRLQELENLGENRIGPRLFCAIAVVLLPPSSESSSSESLSSPLSFAYPLTQISDFPAFFEKHPKIEALYVQKTPQSETSSPSPFLELLSALQKEAEKRQIPLICPIETSVDFEVALTAGVEYLEGGVFRDPVRFPFSLSEITRTLLKEREQKQPLWYIPKLYSFSVWKKFVEKSYLFFEEWEKPRRTSFVADSIFFPYSYPLEQLEIQRKSAPLFLEQAQQNLKDLKKLQEEGNFSFFLGVASFSGDPLNFFGLGLHHQLELLEQQGFSRLACIQAVTEDAAKALGKEHEYGKIEVGYFADLLVLEQNPLEDLKHLRELLWLHTQGQSHWFKHLDLEIPVALKPSRLTSRHLDDFEDGNLLGNNQQNWETFSDELLQGHSRIQIQLVKDGAEGSVWSLKLQGELHPSSEFTAFAGAELPIVPAGEEAVDVSEYEGIAFAVKGKGTLFLKLNTQDIYDWDYPAFALNLEPEWKLYSLPFSLFKQQGFGQKRKWNPERFTGVTWIVYNEKEEIEPVEVQWDELRFFKK
jgi:hypothetical protein